MKIFGKLAQVLPECLDSVFCNLDFQFIALRRKYYPIYLGYRQKVLSLFSAFRGDRIVGHDAVDFIYSLTYQRKASAAEKQYWMFALEKGDSVFEIFSRIVKSNPRLWKLDSSNTFQRMLYPAGRFPDIGLTEKLIPSIRIVDIGAQSLSFEDHIYAPLLNSVTCDVVGFEPIKSEADKRARQEKNLTLLPYFVGDGSDGVFHINNFNPTSSLYESNHKLAKNYYGLSECIETVETHKMNTQRLDDLEEVAQCDFLKIDVQGGELNVLKGASTLLNNTIFIHIEVEFDQVYKDQPLFAEIDSFLRSNDFEFLSFTNFGRNTYKAIEKPGLMSSRDLWTEAIYIKSTGKMKRKTPHLLPKAAFIAHVNYGKLDLAAHLLKLYDETAQTCFYKDYLEYLDNLP